MAKKSKQAKRDRAQAQAQAKAQEPNQAPASAPASALASALASVPAFISSPAATQVSPPLAPRQANCKEALSQPTRQSSRIAKERLQQSIQTPQAQQAQAGGNLPQSDSPLGNSNAAIAIARIRDSLYSQSKASAHSKGVWQSYVRTSATTVEDIATADIVTDDIATNDITTDDTVAAAKDVPKEAQTGAEGIDQVVAQATRQAAATGSSKDALAQNGKAVAAHTGNAAASLEAKTEVAFSSEVDAESSQMVADTTADPTEVSKTEADATTDLADTATTTDPAAVTKAAPPYYPVVVYTPEELAQATKNGAERIVVKGDLAQKLSTAFKGLRTLSTRSLNALALVLSGAALFAPFTGGVSLGAAGTVMGTVGAALTATAIAAISAIGLALVVAVFKGYEEVRFGNSSLELVIRKHQAPAPATLAPAATAASAATATTASAAPPDSTAATSTTDAATPDANPAATATTGAT